MSGLAVISTSLSVVAVATLIISGSGIPARVQAESGAPAPSAAGLERLTEFFQNEVTTGKLPGVIVLIQQHGRPVYLKCFGVRDVATKRPMTPDTIFALHSMTKPITSLAAMMLIEEGRLALSIRCPNTFQSLPKMEVGVDSKTGAAATSSNASHRFGQ